MKKISRLIILLLSLCLLTGCVKYNTSMKINSDGSMNVEVQLLMQEQSEDEENQDDGLNMNTDTSMSEGMKNNLERYGFLVNDYNQNGYVGQVITKNINSIDIVTSNNQMNPVNLYFLLGDEEGTTPPLQYYFYKNGNNYVANFTFDMRTDENEPSGDDMTALYDMFEITYKVTLPERSISNNAHSFSEDGKTLTWNIKYGEENPIKFEFSLPNKVVDDDKKDNSSGILGFIKDNIIYFGIGGLFLLIVIIIVIVYVKKNKKDNQDDFAIIDDGELDNSLSTPSTQSDNVENINAITSPIQTNNPVQPSENVLPNDDEVDMVVNQIPSIDLQEQAKTVEVIESRNEEILETPVETIENTVVDNIPLPQEEIAPITVEQVESTVVTNISQEPMQVVTPVSAEPIENSVVNNIPLQEETTTLVEQVETVRIDSENIKKNDILMPNISEEQLQNIITNSEVNSVVSETVSTELKEQTQNAAVVEPIENSVVNNMLLQEETTPSLEQVESTVVNEEPQEPIQVVTPVSTEPLENVNGNNEVNTIVSEVASAELTEPIQSVEVAQSIQEEIVETKDEQVESVIIDNENIKKNDILMPNISVEQLQNIITNNEVNPVVSETISTELQEQTPNFAVLESKKEENSEITVEPIENSIVNNMPLQEEITPSVEQVESTVVNEEPQEPIPVVTPVSIEPIKNVIVNNEVDLVVNKISSVELQEQTPNFAVLESKKEENSETTVEPIEAVVVSNETIQTTAIETQNISNETPLNSDINNVDIEPVPIKNQLGDSDKKNENDVNNN